VCLLPGQCEEDCSTVLVLNRKKDVPPAVDFEVLSTGRNCEIAIDMKDYNVLRACSSTGELNHLVLCK